MADAEWGIPNATIRIHEARKKRGVKNERSISDVDAIGCGLGRG